MTATRDLDAALRRALVVVEQPTESWPPDNFTDPTRVLRPSLDTSIPDPSVIPLAVVVRGVLLERGSQRSPANEAHPIQALALDRPHE
jgi:hypothetical protein